MIWLALGPLILILLFFGCVAVAAAKHLDDDEWEDI